MKRLLVIGSTCTDVIIRLHHLPVTGGDLHPLWQRFSMGGCAYNTAKIAKAAGVDVTLVTPVGTGGVYSEFVNSNLKKDSFTGPVKIVGAENGCCYCFVEDGGERTFVSVHGVEYTFHEEYMRDFVGQNFNYTYVCGLEVEESTGNELISWLEKHKGNNHSDINAGTIVYAPGPRGAKIDSDKMQRMLDLNPILHLNENEAITLTGIPDIESAAQKLFDRTGNMVVVTLGSDGVLVCTEDKNIYKYPAVPTDVVDTIGAGDSHCGAMLSGMCLGMNIEHTFLFANNISSAVVGTQGAIIDDARVTHILKAFL